jgi:CTP:molybdopterin cytidylyltransferase MocA
VACAGLLLAAGAGRRIGGPKALVRDTDGTPWVRKAATLLADGGCEPVLVVLGAAADEARTLLPPEAGVVVATDWAAGMGASLRAGLGALPRLAPQTDAALVLLVDLPDLVPGIVRRVAALAAPEVLARATYGDSADARHGHPVLLGRNHWDGAAAAATRDRGARDYLDAHEVLPVDCSDLAGGADVDTWA